MADEEINLSLNVVETKEGILNNAYHSTLSIKLIETFRFTVFQELSSSKKYAKNYEIKSFGWHIVKK